MSATTDWKRAHGKGQFLHKHMEGATPKSQSTIVFVSTAFVEERRLASRTTWAHDRQPVARATPSHEFLAHPKNRAFLLLAQLARWHCYAMERTN